MPIDQSYAAPVHTSDLAFASRASVRTFADAQQLSSNSSQSSKCYRHGLDVTANDNRRTRKLFTENSTRRPEAVADLTVTMSPSSDAIAVILRDSLSPRRPYPARVNVFRDARSAPVFYPRLHRLVFRHRRIPTVWFAY